jgi:arginase family enzyme
LKFERGMSTPSHDQVWFQTDEAWDFLPEAMMAGLNRIDVRKEARALRFIARATRIEAFAARHAVEMRPFTLFGSGDFHHLSALWLRQLTEPFHLLSFDNHPDWDIRPPRWSCGAWINRALGNSLVKTVSIWGCGHIECNFPGRLLGNRGAARAGRLRVHPWAQEGQEYPAWLHPITAENWKALFLAWLETIQDQNLYVTIDIDCLTADTALTNWENGRFTRDDLVWALARVREKARIIGGDLCGAWSRPEYGSAFQSFAGWFDHPKIAPPDPAERRSRHERIFAELWPALAGTGNSA